MTILENIRAKIEQEQSDELNGLVASQLQEQAIAAVLGGMGSQAWETYMRNFIDSDNKAQLARLMGTDDTANDPYMQVQRAYLVSNAVCGANTITRLVDRLDDGLLDQGLS